MGACIVNTDGRKSLVVCLCLVAVCLCMSTSVYAGVAEFQAKRAISLEAKAAKLQVRADSLHTSAESRFAARAGVVGVSGVCGGFVVEGPVYAAPVVPVVPIVRVFAAPIVLSTRVLAAPF